MKLIIILSVLFSAQAALANDRCTPDIYRDDAESFCAQELQERIAQMEKDIKGLNRYLIMAFGDEDMRARQTRDCIKMKTAIYKEVLESGAHKKTEPASGH